MPKRILRNAPIAPDAQIRAANGSEGKRDGNGVQSFDGRANTNAGTQHSAVPERLNGGQVLTGEMVTNTK